jgi:hypothetical protein
MRRGRWKPSRGVLGSCRKKYGFRHALLELHAQPSELDPGAGEVLTDDFAVG